MKTVDVKFDSDNEALKFADKHWNRVQSMRQLKTLGHEIWIVTIEHASSIGIIDPLSEVARERAKELQRKAQDMIQDPTTSWAANGNSEYDDAHAAKAEAIRVGEMGCP